MGGPTISAPKRALTRFSRSMSGGAGGGSWSVSAGRPPSMNTPSPPPGVSSVSMRVGRAIADGPPGEGGAARVERMARAMQHVTPEIERLGRALVRLTVDANAPQRRDGLPRRGYRRMEWIESALAPLRDRLDPAAWRRLACALAMVVGWESLIVQRDVCALSVEEGEELSVWVARALVTTALAEARQHQRAVRARALR